MRLAGKALSECISGGLFCVNDSLMYEPPVSNWGKNVINSNMSFQLKRVANESHQQLKRRVRAESQKLYASEAWHKLWTCMWIEYRKKNQPSTNSPKLQN